jgi:hypothetical protein
MSKHLELAGAYLGLCLIERRKGWRERKDWTDV